jgi:hypothetical protein
MSLAMRTKRKTTADASFEIKKSGRNHLKKINKTILQHYRIGQEIF